jgi:hypothetical protein
MAVLSVAVAGTAQAAVTISRAEVNSSGQFATQQFSIRVLP